MQAILGVLFHFFGGFASGSFYIPYKKVKGWAWESYWIVGGIFSWLIVPPLAAYLTIPDFADIIVAAPSQTLLYTYLFGALWGIGGLTYGLGVRYNYTVNSSGYVTPKDQYSGLKYQKAKDNFDRKMRPGAGAIR